MVLQSIETKFYGPTNSRGSRVRAKACAGVLWVSWDYELGNAGNHAAAAEAFAKKFGWDYGDLIGGGNASGDGYNFVFCPRISDK
tara:strand:- start:1338 stop:1592 length:255 start_codon:yes stop_codon:yes gene_type:complete